MGSHKKYSKISLQVPFSSFRKEKS